MVKYLPSSNPQTGMGTVSHRQPTTLERTEPITLEIECIAPCTVDFSGRLTSNGTLLEGRTIRLMATPLDAAGSPIGPEVEVAQGITDTTGTFSFTYTFTSGDWGWVLRYLGD